MEAMTLIELIPTLGFPIICVLFLGWFVYKIYRDTTAANAANMAQVQQTNADNMAAVQARCAERETWLQGVLKEAQEANAKFADVIAKYDSKLDIIQKDVEEIKEKLN